ncbi:MAG: alkaline phosphatase D family protein [Verrucomicrobiota bacterium]|nr:alkaline phosphatase D family protein [Verrucomicrobiota bacterium]
MKIQPARYLRPSVNMLLICLTSCQLAMAAHSFQSTWESIPDRVWIGADYWANPMEDWQITDGRLECLHGARDRNVHLLTADAALREGTLEMEVRLGRLTDPDIQGSAGFRIGIRDEIDDYRARCIMGKGIDIGITHDGFLFVGDQRAKNPIADTALTDLLLAIRGETRGKNFLISIEALSTRTRASHGFFAARLKDTDTTGNVALVNNHQSGKARYWFRQWKVAGSKLDLHANRKWGPILWTMHTLHHDGQQHTLSLTAQMPPLGKSEASDATFQYRVNGDWIDVGPARIDPLSRTANWNIIDWPANQDRPYRVLYKTHQYAGTIRRDPNDRQALVIAGFTGNQDTGFPNLETVRNIGIQDPDMLFFSGDQIYENVGGYGILREGVERPVLNYLRKWYLLGWAFGDLMRDRITVCLPDDHDVYQGNIWGEGGAAMEGDNTSTNGGYIQHPAFVNAVHRTQTSHHPKMPDPAPILQGILPFHNHLVYGRVSFALIADRMFKTGPKAVATWEGRADHLRDKTYDVSKLDQAGLELLGKRQETFLESWITDWRGADFKCLLSQSIFVNLANYHGADQTFIYADLDSNGWPQTPRNRALSILRKGFVFHYAGDQHLPSVTRYGVEHWNDAGYAFCVPSIAAGYPRAWRPDTEGRLVQNRGNGPNTGEYHDAFGNHVTVWAIGNPEQQYRSGRMHTLHDKASGYGIVRFNKSSQTIDMECYRLETQADQTKEGDQFPGWPLRIHITDNDGRQPQGFLKECHVDGVQNAVVQVWSETDNILQYVMRIQGNRFRPWVFTEGIYRVRMGDPDMDIWKTWEHLEIQP